MAKIVIAGSAGCPYYAKVELLADALVQNLENFKLHKIVKPPSEWQAWLEKTCTARGWDHTRSPMIWRELVDRGGKGVLIGGANEFQEYTKAYYDVLSSLTSNDMRKIAEENLKIRGMEDEALKSSWGQSNPVGICLTCATGPVAYAMISGIAQGEALGCSTEVALKLYDSIANKEMLQGVAMEAFDLGCHLLSSVSVADDVSSAFSDCSTIVLLDEVIRSEEESKEDWIKRNYELFANYGKILNDIATQDVRVIVANNGPVNFNAWTLIHNAPNIPRHNVVAHSRLVENRAKGILSQRLGVNSAGMADVVVWGNINGANYVDVHKARVFAYDGAIWGPPSFSRSVVEMVHDNKWVSTEFLEMLAQRGVTLAASMKHSASGSLGESVVSLLNHWTNGSPDGELFSLGVFSEGWYDLPSDMVISLPVTFSSEGRWVIVPDLDLPTEVKAKLQDIVQELKAEIDVLFGPPKPETPAAEVYDSEEEAEVTTQEKAEQEDAEKPSGEQQQEQEEGQQEEQKEADPVEEVPLAEEVAETEVAETEVAETEGTDETVDTEAT